MAETIEETYETAVRRKVVRTSLKIQEVSPWKGAEQGRGWYAWSGGVRGSTWREIGFRFKDAALSWSDSGWVLFFGVVGGDGRCVDVSGCGLGFFEIRVFFRVVL